MPHINRIRVNNVKYNFGTQFYDNFILRFDGKNALYDLANGGGKSVLMLLLFQNLIPNCTLDDKQPVEKLFRTDQGSTTIHSMIEWKLDERFIKDGYKYMLTGFCARKAREEQKETAAIEYFNYVIFYRGYNDNDLVNLPLSNGKERVTYTGLKNYLKDLGKKDMSLDIRIFERKGEYQRYISQYGLYESHWEILRGINKTEGHVRTYFENRYRTTRKIVEDLLIEEIIQRAFSQNSQSGADMADTLVQIKDKLAELAERKEEMGAYERQTEILESLSGRTGILKKAYEEKEELDTNLVKTYHTVAGLKRLREKDLAVYQKEKEYAAKHRHEISRKLDTVRIQKNQELLKQLEEDTEKYAAELSGMEEEYKKKQRALDMEEAVRDYIIYMDVKSKWEALKVLLSHDQNDSDGRLKELNHLAAMRRVCDGEERERLQKKLSAVEKAESETKESHQQSQEMERQLFCEGAVLDSQLLEEKKRENESQEVLNGLLCQLPVLIPENADQILSEKKQLRGANELKYQQLSEKQLNLEKDIVGYESQIEQCKAHREKLLREKEELDRFFSQYAIEREKSEQLVQIYHSPDITSLLENIDSQLRKTILDIELKSREIQLLRKKLTHLSEGNPTVMGEETAEVIEYIRKCHGHKCIFGGDYLKEVSDYDRDILIERMPFLPEAVIVESGLADIRGDAVLMQMDTGDRVIPVVSLPQVMRQEEVIVSPEILFLSGNPELYKNPSARQEMCDGIQNKLEQCVNKLARLKDREKTIQTDRKYMIGFELNYEVYYSEKAERSVRVMHQLDEENKRILKCEELLGLSRDALEGNRKLVQRMEEENRNLDSDIELLSQMKHCVEQLKTIRDKQKKLEAAQRKNADLRKNEEEKIRYTQDTIERLENERKALLEGIENLDKQWREVYEPYYISGTEETPDISSSDIDARFKGIREAYEREHLDLEDKKQLMESYRQTMDTLLVSVRRKDISVVTLENMAKEHRLAEADDTVLRNMADELKSLKETIRQKEAILFQYRENKNKLFGNVEHGVSSIEEKYGSFESVSLINSDYESFFRQQSQALELMKEKQQKAEVGIENAFRDIRSFEDMKRDLERMIRNANLMLNRTQETFGPEIDIYKKYRECSEKQMRMHTEIQKQREAFDRDKEKAAENLSKAGAQELAGSIRSEVSIPSSSELCAEFMHQLKDTAQIIRLEKERIEKTISDMVRIKQNFEKQCLQRCLSIRAELERFPAFSRIFLDGKTIPMVMLKIPYIREEMYEQRMSEYIDGIVAQTDLYHTQEERVGYIRQQLSWKRLFSVIVTDMNSIRLSLYKRERVKEQSRYLKYEEAVGSTGQSQGIYIQFLIGVINYISMVYSGSGDSSKLQKVIFIDNPFGAAKDIYIWQPIFELLRTNHVQLIVPTRGATPAITGKFDVNYILGQRMIDKMQQTVVVDYSSNVDVSEMDYEKLEFEQEVFDFI